MQVGTYGVFHGGTVSVNTLQAGIDVTALTVRASDGRNLGFGAPGRKVLVAFNQPTSPFDFTALRPSPLDAPIYTLLLSANAGFAYLAFDTLNTNDITVIAAPATGFVVLAKVTWPANTTTLAQLVLDLVDRQESRLMASTNPLSPQDLYTAGMRFGDAEFNKPLISFAILSEVLQGEAIAKNNDEFSFVVADPTDVEGVGTTLTVHPVKVVLRRRVGPDTTYTVIETKTDFTFTYVVASLLGDRIYIWVDVTTGEVFSGTTYTPPDGVLVGYGDVPFSATTLADVPWVLASQVADANAQSGTSVSIQNATLPSGFVKKSAATTSTVVQKSLLVAENVAIIKGVEYRVPEQQIIFPDAPLTGERMDLLFAEFYRSVDPSPPTSGEFYINVPGVGFIVAHTRYVIIANVPYVDAQNLMLQAGVTGLGGGNFVREPGGHYASPYLPAADGYSYALPVALVSRFNQAPFADTNLDGGGLSGLNSTRPDGKKHNFIHIDEVELPGPILGMHGFNHAAIFGKILHDILRGQHPNKLGRSSQLPNHYSKRPLQLDAMSSSPVAGANLLSALDGVRREWSAAPVPYWLGTHFQNGLDATSTFHAFEDGSRTVTLIAPIDATLWLGGLGGTQPVVQLVWVDTGAPVQLTGAWSVGVDAQSATAIVDDGAPGYEPSGLIALSFAVIQDAVNFLGNTPTQVYSTTLNGNAFYAAQPDPTTFTFATLPATLDPVGPTTKAEAFSVETVVLGAGSSLITVPATVGGVAVIGVRSVVAVTTSTVVGIKTVVLGTPTHAVTLAAAVALGDQLRVTLLLAGSLCNIVPTNRTLGDFSEATIHTQTINGGGASFNLVLPHNRVLRGLYSYARVANAPLVQGVYIDDYLYPATVTGFDRNFVVLNLTLTLTDYAALPPAQQAKWQLDLLNNYYYLNVGTYALKLALLWSSALAVVDTFKVTYAYHGLPWSPIAGGEEFDLLHKGYIVASNSSIANRSPSYTHPLAERFPAVRGTIQGPTITTPETTLSDPALMELSGFIPFEGLRFGIDGSLDFGLGISAPGDGFMVWASLVKDGPYMKLLAYVVQDNAFSISDDAKAFVSYCDANYVE